MQAKRILIVDDEPGARKLVGLILADEFDVKETSNVAEAMISIQRELPSVVITDIKMPGQDGLSLLAHLHQNYPRMPVILMTGHGDKEMVIQAIRGGAFDLLEKPFGEQDLKLCVRKAVEYTDLVYANERMLEQIRERNDELEKLNNEVIETQAQLMGSAKMAALGVLTEDIVEDMNHPLGNIKYMNDTLFKFTKETELNREKLQMAAKDLDRSLVNLTSLIEGLRFLAHDGWGDSYEDVVLADVFAQINEFYTWRAKKMGVQFHVSTPPTGIIFNARQVQLFQVLVSLINNSLHAIRELPDAWVRIDYKDNGDDLSIFVIDCGKGIPQELHEKVFLPFCNRHDGHGWNGLGLSLSRSILESHSGSLEIKTDSPNTCFELRIPKSSSMKQTG